ncbi:MotA/TolQ/ExbB proton channel family protein [Colwellia psychrerythraea]|uniref:Biopolymer transport protein ExbB n=1 Tax=Colwellia psychrerythraea TaxID=28229 RepID=A0A099L3L1_COLPS|nr:MotA/TolQ/ExbB proton channel family protein [Colwellia psychrerythraea]KGJ97534.1 MotA/TolQ/ExbB proton channel [Colwellia psychrerythraea]
MENSYGIAAMWSQSDAVIKAVAISLLMMSIASWCVILLKARKLYLLNRPLKGSMEFWHSQDINSGLKLLYATGTVQTPFSKLVNEGLDAKKHHAQYKADLHGSLPLSEWITTCLRTSIEDSKTNLQQGLAILASVGSTAPFIGLLGTVWGIYHALVAIGASGQAGIDKVAGPVGEALIMTAFGLAVAIPAVLGYNALTRGNKRVINRLNHFAHELHAFMVIGSAPTKTNGKKQVKKSESTVLNTNEVSR